MKKRYALLLICALCLGLLLYNLFGVTDPTDIQQDRPTTGFSASDTSDPTQPESPSETISGQVRVLNTDPDRQEIWTELAEQYTAQTNVEVVILDGTEEAQPTLFTVTGAEELTAEKCQDLSGTTALSQLADMGLTLVVDGKYCGIATQIDCFGLIFNENILAEIATPEEITDISGFATFVQGIAAKGYTPFAGRGLDDTVATRLASIPGSIQSLAKLWVAHASANQETSALERFLAGEAVFYLGSTDEYEEIIAGGVEAVGILPLYLDTDKAGYQQSLCVTAERYWCVSSEAASEDVAATLAFLDWLVVPSEDGKVPVDTLELLAPYRQASYYANPLEATLRQDLLAGKSLMVCQRLTQPPAGYVEALISFAQDPTEENWAKVEQTKQ